MTRGRLATVRSIMMSIIIAQYRIECGPAGSATGVHMDRTIGRLGRGVGEGAVAADLIGVDCEVECMVLDIECSGRRAVIQSMPWVSRRALMRSLVYSRIEGGNAPSNTC